MKNKFWLGAFLILMAALILAACGTGQGDETETSPKIRILKNLERTMKPQEAVPMGK